MPNPDAAAEQAFEEWWATYPEPLPANSLSEGIARAAWDAATERERALADGLAEALRWSGHGRPIAGACRISKMLAAHCRGCQQLAAHSAARGGRDASA